MEAQEPYENCQIEEILVCEICGNSVSQNDYEKHLKNHYKAQRGN